MKQIYRAVTLAVFTAFVTAGCATSGGSGEIQTKYTPTEADKANKALEAKVAAALKAEPQLAKQFIFPSAKDGVVTLTGITKNSWLSYLAGTIAKSTEGVKSVKNEIKVE